MVLRVVIESESQQTQKVNMRKSLRMQQNQRALATAPMIEITPDIQLDPSELRVSFIRASGPGGQNVNKVATAVQLRFDAANSPSLPDTVKQRLLRLAGSRATAEGEIVIEAKRFRTQTP